MAALALLVALSLLSLAAPELVAPRFRPVLGLDPAPQPGAMLDVARVLWAPLLAAALILVLDWRQGAARRPRTLLLGVLAASALAFVGMLRPLHDWVVDDAGITFAYAQNLVDGHGLVARPGHPPEEGYSNTLWMLTLAGAAWLGFDLEAAGKLGSQLLGLLALGLGMASVTRSLDPRPRGEYLLLALAIVLGAPFVVWSASGLEASLQALLLTAAGVAPLWSRRWEWVAGSALAALVLTRPEAPLVTLALAALLLVRGLRGREPRLVFRFAVLTMPPFAIWLGLLAFRLLYFGDPFPNPYYAKAHDANLLRLVNVLGGGWQYVLDWASASGIVVVLPQILFAVGRPPPLAVQTSTAVVLAQMAFCVIVGGDWMNEFRFLAPILPLLALLAAWSCQETARTLGESRARLVAAASAGLLFLLSTRALLANRIEPTTPLRTVAAIGETFVKLARCLEIPDPLLAHHDAGGIVYRTRLDLIDLGGLVDREVAKHMDDRDWMVNYLLVERRPTFVFGANASFAAGETRFFEDPRFERDYVPLEFPGRPYMKAELHHVRRERVREAPGVDVVRGERGIEQVVVTDPCR